MLIMRQNKSLTVLFLLAGLLVIAACESSFNRPENSQSLDVILLGTHGYTTAEQLGKTIEDYDSTLEYDETRLPDTQVGFPLELPITFFNQGQQSWYDFQARLEVIITDPIGNETHLSLPSNAARVMRQRIDDTTWYRVKEKASAFERRLAPKERRVFFFQTDYTPTIPGVYTLLIELRSKGMGVMRIAKSGFTVHVYDATSGITTTSPVCSLYQSCTAAERCCSKGSDVPIEQRQGHCAAACSSGEVEIAFSISSLN